MNFTVMVTPRDIIVGVLVVLCALLFAVAHLIDVIERRRKR